MAKSNRPKKKPQIKHFKPSSYLTSGQARKLPIHECWLNPNWQEMGFATVVVCRRHVNGNFSYATYLLDTCLMGLKDTMFFANETPDNYEKLANRIFAGPGLPREKISYELAHNLVYGAIAYADEFGMTPNADWAVSQYILDEDTDDVPLMELEFGRDGMPTWIPGPYDNYGKVFQTLLNKAGEGNFDVVLRDGDSYQEYLSQGLPFTLETILTSIQGDDEEWDEEDWDEDDEEDWDEEEEEGAVAQANEESEWQTAVVVQDEPPTEDNNNPKPPTQ
jgi:hypothetical protein